MKRFIATIFLIVIGMWVPTVRADIGQDFKDVLIEVGKGVLSDDSSSTVSNAVGDAVIGMLEDAKKQFEEEAQVYAKKFGDIVSERIMENERVKRLVNTVEVTCLAIVIYLVLVTLLLFLSLRRLYLNDRIILKLLNEMGKREGEGA